MAKKIEGTEPAVVSAPKVFMDVTAFRNMSGETFAGLNILKLEPGQAAGPLTITKILLNQDLGSGGTGKRKKKPVDVYVANDPEGTEVRLPVAASLTMKLKDAKVGPGDVVAILRGDDYKSKVYGTRGASYELKVLSRKNSSKK